MKRTSKSHIESGRGQERRLKTKLKTSITDKRREWREKRRKVEKKEKVERKREERKSEEK